MIDVRTSDKYITNANNYNVSVDGNLVHHIIREDDYKITVTVDATQADKNSGTKTKEKEKED